ncbi:hypothetical protein IQ273_20180 [Nodosilinea sp. LEGE 07298]|uniref:hypothetical protein n=1 Tax=Nodosilinea sp. LEGE 07298 TaxID=2777970 RepID=UPI001882654B|nr:hypothetical protein [Nodosilinea sp. LEGE 07298]MBE9111728.1 hypothetical protein [Nodosilinea sp. LEGE 07298]
MSFTDLSPNQDFFNEEDAIVEFNPDGAFLSSSSVLSLLAAFDPGFADLVADFANDLPNATGQVTVADGLFDANLRLADGTALTGSFNAPATLRTYADLAAVSDATVTLSRGILTAAIAADGQTTALPGFDLSAATSALVLDAVNAIDATVPLSNGAFALDLATALGPISGTIDIAGGDLNLDLVTPFGQLVADVEFQDDAIFPFTAPVPVLGDINGAVDFNSGNIVASLGPFGNLAVPISALSGSLTLADGLANLDATLPIGAGLSLPVATDIEIGPLASEYIAEFVQDLEGPGTLANGILDATIASPLGLFDTTFDVVAFTNQGADFFAGIDGVVDIGGGIATALLTTPLGDISDNFDLATVAPALETPVAELI